MEQQSTKSEIPVQTPAKQPWSTPRLLTEGKVVEVTLIPFSGGRG